jgi:hypothetical protein
LTIQKKSLISSLNTTKKAIVASSPLEAPTPSEKQVKMVRLATANRLGAPALKLGTAHNRMARMAKLARFAKISD